MNGKRRVIGRAALAAALAAGAWGAGAETAVGQGTLKRSPVDGHDTSPHTVRRVLTGRDVEVEVVDWGGTGPALIFLAGLGNTAHVWDDFAPRFTHGFHVIGITRRGFGASSKPATGYDSATLADDILAVMDAMRIPRASFVAHSFAGTELNWLAVRAQARVNRMVYVDAGFDWAELFATPEYVAGPFPRPRLADGGGTPGEMAAWYAKVAGPGYPESEVRAQYRLSSYGRVGEMLIADSAFAKLMAGTPRATVRQVLIPSLAIYGVPRTVRDRYPWYDQMTPEEKRAAEARFELERDLLERQRIRFRTEMRRGLKGVVTIPGAQAYVFLSHDRDVEVHVRRFLQSPTIGDYNSPVTRIYH